MAIDKSLISGSTAMLIMHLLSEKDMYGYEMIVSLRKKSNMVFELKTGTLYPLLHSLEIKGYLESYTNYSNAKPRKYYSLTKRGLAALNDKKREWNEFSSSVGMVLGGNTL